MLLETEILLPYHGKVEDPSESPNRELIHKLLIRKILIGEEGIRSIDLNLWIRTDRITLEVDPRRIGEIAERFKNIIRFVLEYQEGQVYFAAPLSKLRNT